MDFSTLSNYFSQIEPINSRLKMTEILASLLNKAYDNEIAQMCYLGLGMLAPKFKGLELNMADKMVIKVIAQVVNQPLSQINTVYKQTGDLGETIFKLKKTTPIAQHKSVVQVYSDLLGVALETGIGSQERKINRMVKLLHAVDNVSAKYIVRIILKKLRLGFSDMTVLDSLSWMVKKDKSLRPQLETAYNVRADIGQIAQIFKRSGLNGIIQMVPETGTPIVPARATPLIDIVEIFDKMKGRPALEPKYDGFRVQIHMDKSKEFKLEKPDNLALFDQDKKGMVQIFSRNLDNITHMFPELVKSALDLPIQSGILDGEALAVDPKTGQFLDFQETVKRKRKHNIDKVQHEIPLKAYIFDLLYLNGKSLLAYPFLKRREFLQQALDRPTGSLELTPQVVIDNELDFQKFFSQVSKKGLEGLMAKKTDSIYKAGARDFTWVKYKVAMQAGMADTVDAVVMGYFKGQGKWAKLGLGKVLVGIPEADKILSLSKVGSGFSEDTIKEMLNRSKNLVINQQPDSYEVDKTLLPDVWLRPEMVVEIRADSISRSPFYETGLSLRFPRFVRFRDDKSPGDATSRRQLLQMAHVIK